VLALLLAGALVAFGLTLVPSGYATPHTTTGENLGADNPPPEGQGNCKHANGSVHNGYDCLDADGDTDDPGDNDGDDATMTPGAPTPAPGTPTNTSVTPGTTPTVANTNGASPPAPGIQQVAGATVKRVTACASRRQFVVHVRQLHGLVYHSATVSLRGHKVKTVKGAARIKAGIVLAGLPRGTFHVKLTVVTTTGRVLRNTRTYHTCVPRRPHTIPKL
jgi:hypothetical protein